MDSFIFAIQSTVPVFLVMVLGWYLKRKGILGESFCKQANQYVFKVALPMSLFGSVSQMDLYTDFDLRFCLFCFIVTCVMFFSIWGLSWWLMKDKTLVAEFTQACARSSAAILGIALANSIYGSAGLVPMMIVAAVPFFNIFSVLILAISPKEEMKTQQSFSQLMKSALKSVATNPIIIAIVLGIPFALFQIKLPQTIQSFVSMVGGTASPIALLVVGASLIGAEAVSQWKLGAVASVIKLVVLPLIFLPIAGLMGFRDSAMIAILIMVGSPATVAGYIMAKNMGHRGVLSSNCTMMTTVLSAFTITFFVCVMRMLGWI